MANADADPFPTGLMKPSDPSGRRARAWMRFG
jgi:hypothetical protein